MRDIFRITCVVVLTAIYFITCASTVSADKTDWTDENYKFSNIQRVYLCKVDTFSFTDLDASTVEKIQNSCKKFADKLKGVVFVDSEELADIKIVTKITRWTNWNRPVPESIEVYYEGWEKRRVKDRDGKWRTESHHKTSRAYFPGANRRERKIPAHNIQESLLKVFFEVYDTKNENLIMSREDVRDKGGWYKQTEMFKRSCKDFFKELNKILKQ